MVRNLQRVGLTRSGIEIAVGKPSCGSRLGPPDILPLDMDHLEGRCARVPLEAFQRFWHPLIDSVLDILRWIHSIPSRKPARTASRSVGKTALCLNSCLKIPPDVWWLSWIEQSKPPAAG
jgi:hypothetical protein